MVDEGTSSWTDSKTYPPKTFMSTRFLVCVWFLCALANVCKACLCSPLTSLAANIHSCGVCESQAVVVQRLQEPKPWSTSV